MFEVLVKFRVEFEFAVKVPATENIPVEFVTIAEEARVRLLKVRVPELEMVEPLLNVIVPPVGARFLPELIVKVPPME